MQKITLASLALFSILIAQSLQVLAQATFGAEFTFTNSAILEAQTQPHIVNNPQSELYRDKMAQAALSSCDGCRLKISKNSYSVTTYKIIYPDGFYFVIATDPSVVEVQTKPMTTTEINKNALRLQRDLFDAALSVGMAPDRDGTGGGHIHIGFMSAINGNLQLMRNILVDFANHPEIASGILTYENDNSPALAKLPAKNQETFRKIIEDVDTRIITDVVTLAKRIQNEVYNWHPAGWTPSEKHQAMNITRIADINWNENERTIEVRSIRPQKSVAEYQMLTQLLEGRIEFIKTRKEPITLNIPQHQNEQEKYEHFAKYAGDAGIDFYEFRKSMKISRHSVAFNVLGPKPRLLCFKLFRD